MKLVKIIKVELKSVNNLEREPEPKYFLNHQQAAFYLCANGISYKAISEVKCIESSSNYYPLKKVADYSGGRYTKDKVYTGEIYVNETVRFDTSTPVTEIDQNIGRFFYLSSKSVVFAINKKIDFTPMPKEYLAIEQMLVQALDHASSRIAAERTAQFNVFAELQRAREQKEQELKIAQDAEREANVSYVNQFGKLRK